MRARRRRSVLNTVSAAVLEVAIMGLFVIIAQPQLRDALFEILHAGEPLPAAHSNTNANNRQVANATPMVTLDRTLQAVANSPVGQAIENSFSQWANGSRPETNVPSLNVPSLYAPLEPAPSLLPSTSTPIVNSGLRDQPGQRQVAGYSPYEQYESFRVNVPTNNQLALQQTIPNNYGQVSPQPYAVPQYVPPQGSSPQHYGAQSYGQNYPSTQLNGNQWNIASAAQSPRPNVNGNANNWIPSQVTETSFRQVHPPPYGTQSMWK